MIISNWIWVPPTADLNIIGVMIQNPQMIWVCTTGNTIKYFLMKLFQAFYLHVLDLNLWLISTTITSITTHLILICTSVTSNVLAKTISQPLCPLRGDLRSKSLWSARLKRTTTIRLKKLLTSVIRTHFLYHHYLHWLNMNHFNLSRLLLLQNCLRN